MLRILSIILTLVLLASPAFAWDDNVGQVDTTIRLKELSNNISRSFVTCGEMSYKPSSITTGTYSLYTVTDTELLSITDSSDVISVGTLVDTFDATDNNTTTIFTPSGADDRIIVVSTAVDNSRRSELELTCNFGSGGSTAGVFNVLDYGAYSDATVDHAAAFNAAKDAACAATPVGKVYIPAGSYGLGAGTNNQSAVYSGMHADCSGLEIYGDGVATKLHPLAEGGNYLIYACDGVTSSSVAACTTYISNIWIHDLWIEDLDQEAHGHHYIIASEGTLSGGTPAFGDQVTWTGGSGTIAGYDAADTGQELRIRVGATDTFDATETVTNGVWTATASALVEDISTEESHGIGARLTEDLRLTDLWIKSISDESIDLNHSNKDFLVSNATITDVNALGNGGSAVAVGAGCTGVISNSFFEGGVGARNSINQQLGQLLAFEANTANGGIEVSVDSVRMVEDSAAEEDQVGTVVNVVSSAASAPMSFAISNSMLINDTNVNGNDFFRSSGTSSPVKITLSNSLLAGSSNHNAAHDVEYSNNSHTDTTTDSGTFGYVLVGVDRFIGGSYSSTSAGRLILFNSDGSLITGARISNTVGDVIHLDGVDGLTVTNTFFAQCGDTGLRFCINEKSGATKTVVSHSTYGTYLGTAPPFRVGTTIGTHCNNGSWAGTAGSVCDETTIREIP